MTIVNTETNQQKQPNAARYFYSIFVIPLLSMWLSYGISIVIFVASSNDSTNSILYKIMDILILTPILLSTISVILYLSPLVFYVFKRTNVMLTPYEEILEKQATVANAFYKIRSNVVVIFIILSTVLSFVSIIYHFVLYFI